METEAPEKQIQAPGVQFVRVAECLYRHATSGVYYALVKRKQRQIRRSLETTDRKLAERKLADFRRSALRLSMQAGCGKLTFAELADRWIALVRTGLKVRTGHRRDQQLKRLKKTFGSYPIRQITPEMCEDWMMKRSPKIAASTFNKDLEVLHGVFGYAIRQGILLNSPAEALEKRKQPKLHIVIPSKEQFRLLVEALLKKDSRYWQAADFVQLLAYSGMRLGEATQIKWNEVDFERESFVVTGGEHGTKNHEDRTVPLFPALRQLLEDFKSRQSMPPTLEAKILSATKANKALSTVCKETKLPHFTHHSLRHYFVSNAIEAGVDFKTIAAWVGHKDGGILVAETYGHLRDVHSQEMAKRMTFSVKTKPSPAVVPFPTKTTAA